MSEKVKGPGFHRKIASIIGIITTPPPNSADLEGAKKGPLDRCKVKATKEPAVDTSGVSQWLDGCEQCGKLGTECDGHGYKITEIK